MCPIKEANQINLMHPTPNLFLILIPKNAKERLNIICIWIS